MLARVKIDITNQFQGKILDKKTFGKLDAALYGRDKKYYSSSWRGKYKSDGGVLFNQSIHLLDVLIYFFGKVKILMF